MCPAITCSSMRSTRDARTGGTRWPRYATRSRTSPNCTRGRKPTTPTRSSRRPSNQGGIVVTGSAEYEQSRDRIRDLAQQLKQKFPAVERAAEAGRQVLNDLDGDMFRWFGYFWDALKALVNGVVSLLKMILEALDKLLEWLLAPFWLFDYAKRWRIEVGNPAYTLATDIQDPATRNIGAYWSGEAANRYMTVVPPPQVRAANRVGDLAKQIASSLNTIGGLGLGYLITMIGGIVIILKYIIATIAAIAGGVTAPAGAVTASIAYATWAGL